MAKSLYTGMNGVAKKGKKSYYGVNGVARKVKKMYYGVGNVARLFWTAINNVQGSGDWPTLSNTVTINCGFKPEHILIWNETVSNKVSDNEFVYIYSSGPRKHASYLVASDDDHYFWGSDILFTQILDNGFTFGENRGFWVGAKMDKFYYLAFPADHNVVSGTASFKTTGVFQTVAVNVGFKPRYVAATMEFSESDETKHLQRVLYVDGNLYGVSGFEDETTGSMNHAITGTIEVTDTGFKFIEKYNASSFKKFQYYAFE